MEFKRILVAVNSLTRRDAAFERALALARSSGAELYVLYAVPLNQPFSFGGTERLERMAELRQRAEAAGVRIDTAEQHGDPAEIIQLHADARDIDLIVMGVEARAGWGRRRSAVAERVIRRTNVPTLLVASDAGDEAAPFRNVLVAVDLSAASTDVMRGAIAVAADEATHVTVMHTVTGLEAADAVQSHARWMVPEFRGHVIEDARRALEEVLPAARAGVNRRVQLSTGSAARTILDHAAAVDADLVVVGRSRGFKVLGSTALRLVRKTDRALLVIPNGLLGEGRAERQRAA